MVKKISDIIFNVFYYKIALMLFLIPTLLVYCVEYNYKLLFIMMGWGALVCVYDLLIRRNFVKARGMLWLIGFLVIFALSVVINFRTGFTLNVSSWAYCAIALFVLYPDSAIKDKNTVVKELSVINNIFIAMTTVMSTISLGMYVCLYGERVPFGDQVYSIGWTHNRLFGVYSNTGYMITAIGLAIILIQVAVAKAKDGKLKKPYIAFLAYTAFVNFCSMCMENAKGAFISLAAFFAIGAFFITLRKLLKKGKKTVVSGISSFVAAVLAVGIMFGVIYGARPLLAYVPSVYKSLGGTMYNESQQGNQEPDTIVCENCEHEFVLEEETTDSVENEQSVEESTSEADKKDKKVIICPNCGAEIDSGIQGIEIDRNIDESYGFLTGRTTIWKFGLKEFAEKPIFGHGPQSHRDTFVVDNYLRHFHNLIVQTIVSVGAVGSIFIFGFFILVFLFILKKVFQKAKDGDDNYYVAVLLFAILGMFLVNSMAEVTILFITRFAMFMFWMFLGYTLALVNDGEKSKDMKFLEGMNDKINNIFKKK